MSLIVLARQRLAKTIKKLFGGMPIIKLVPPKLMDTNYANVEIHSFFFFANTTMEMNMQYNYFYFKIQFFYTKSKLEIPEIDF